MYMYIHINSINLNVDFSIVTWDESDKIDVTHDHWQQRQSPPSILAQNMTQSRMNLSRNIAEQCILCCPG
jgi:hypothetical protein